MQRSRWIWLVWIVVLLCYLVPFTLLRDMAAWYGSFLFWTLAGVVVIAVNVYITGAYRHYDRRDSAIDSEEPATTPAERGGRHD